MTKEGLMIGGAISATTGPRDANGPGLRLAALSHGSPLGYGYVYYHDALSSCATCLKRAKPAYRLYSLL
jgi:hypothetical protein